MNMLFFVYKHLSHAYRSDIFPPSLYLLTKISGNHVMFTLVILITLHAAGYSVITYLLGVGDRHLDNLLLSESGHLIHVDFGYILGRDPKVFPPPMKLNKEMVEGMGGTSSVEYQRFREHCYNAFLALRR